MDVESAVARALANAALSRQRDAEISATRAELTIETSRTNPQWELTHEQVFGDLNVGYRESTAQLEQGFDLVDWRTSRRAALPHRERALVASWQLRELELSHEVRHAFYTLLYHQQRVQIARAWIKRLETAREGLTQREARGDVSSYQVRRIASEITLARATLDTEAAALELASSELTTLTAIPPEQLKIVGVLWSMDAPLALPAEAQEPLNSSQTLRLDMLHELELATTEEARAHESSSFWRGWSVVAGYRNVSVGPSVGHGFILSLSGPLTLTDTQEPHRQALAARRIRLEAEIDLLTARTQQRTDEARKRLLRASEVVAKHHTALHDTELTSMAQLAFDTGEAPLSELLDAFELEARMLLVNLDLELEARRAQIALDYILKTGDLP